MTSNLGNLYETPPMVIGAHEWRCTVRIFDPNKHCTVYQFRRIGETFWRDHGEWRTYDSDKWDNGLPAGLRRLWDQFLPAIRAALDDLPPPPLTAGLPLFEQVYV